MKDEPMPLKDLPEYIKSARETGQSEYPVVQMGTIVAQKSSPFRFAAYAAAGCLFMLTCGMLGYGTASKEIVVTVQDDMNSEEVGDMISQGGAKVVSIRQKEDKTYEVRVLTLRGMGSLLDGLRKNKEFRQVESKD